jgi:hypothetical protein
MDNITSYMRAHPWATGIIIIVGGIVFLMLSGVMGGGAASSASADTGPSDAEIAANATIAAAQINAQAQAAAAGAAVQTSQIGAGVQMASDQLAAQVAMRELEVRQALGLDEGVTNRYGIEAQKSVRLGELQSQVDLASTYANTQVKMNASNNKQKNVGGIIGGVTSLIGSAFSIFSDQGLKENIKYVGTNPRGIRIYEFNYRGSKTIRRGPIAQDMAREHPEAVTIDNDTGYMMVLPNQFGRPGTGYIH